MMSHIQIIFCLCFGLLLLSVYRTTCQMQSSHPASPPPCLEEAQLRLNVQTSTAFLRERARRSRFPHTQPTTLLLHLPPTDPSTAALSAYWALKKSFHRFTPCLVFGSHDSRALEIPLPLFGSLCCWTVCCAFTLLLLACALFIYIISFMSLSSYKCMCSSLCNTISHIPIHKMFRQKKVLSYFVLFCMFSLSLIVFTGTYSTATYSTVVMYWKLEHHKGFVHLVY